MTSSTTSSQIINTQNQPAPQPPSVLFNPTASVPASHILPNLSAWTFPTVTTSPPTRLRTPLQTSQPTISTTTTTSVGSTLVITMPIMPVTQGGIVFYVPPSAVTVPTPILTIVQPSSSFPSATTVPFLPSGSSAVLEPSPTHLSLRDFEILRNI